jgi:hypothetical protein
MTVHCSADQFCSHLLRTVWRSRIINIRLRLRHQVENFDADPAQGKKCLWGSTSGSYHTELYRKPKFSKRTENKLMVEAYFSHDTVL